MEWREQINHFLKHLTFIFPFPSFSEKVKNSIFSTEYLLHAAFSAFKWWQCRIMKLLWENLLCSTYFQNSLSFSYLFLCLLSLHFSLRALWLEFYESLSRNPINCTYQKLGSKLFWVQCKERGLPSLLSGKESTSQCRRHMGLGFSPWVGKIPWRRR